MSQINGSEVAASIAEGDERANGKFMQNGQQEYIPVDEMHP